jgi:hypothetical protein
MEDKTRSDFCIWLTADTRWERIQKLEEENADLKKELAQKYGKISHIYNEGKEAEIQNLKAKLANRDLNLADRDRRIDALESDLKLISLIAAHVRVVERNQ